MLAAIVAAGLAVTAASCPLTLPREALTVRAPQGWDGYAPSPMRLTGFGMLAGPPSTMSYLVPTSTKPGQKSWHFDRGEEKWLYCTYDGSAAIQIAKRMDDAATVCELSHKKDKHGGIGEMKAVCR